MRCDSLSSLYLWHIKYSYYFPHYTTNPVVIRFQVCIFDILNTAKKEYANDSISCDSLSSLYLWHIKYSIKTLTPQLFLVVIRFQVCIFDILNTAQDRGLLYRDSCDSLSSLYLWHIKYSAPSSPPYSPSVVIRFQVCIFDILNTAGWYPDVILYCCDSLSSLYLWHIKYSSSTKWNHRLLVVIRFQVCIFDILNTATGHKYQVECSCDSLSSLYLWHIKYSRK